jgi:uncharacterized protein (DUF4415 family)
LIGGAICCLIKPAFRRESASKTMAHDRSRRAGDPRKTAEAAFKAATAKPVEGPAIERALPGVRELVSLRIDKDVLEYFQEEGPGWQERINAALRKAAGK